MSATVQKNDKFFLAKCKINMYLIFEYNKNLS